jgi:putative flippase GtrA
MSSWIVFRRRFDERGVAAAAPTLAKFFAAGFSGLLVTAIVVGLLADIMGVHPLLAKICAASGSFSVVFLSLRLFVFNHASKPSTSKPAQIAA